MEVKPIPANEVQSVTLPVDFYADLVVKARTLELLQRAMLENVTTTYNGEPSITTGFDAAIKAIIPDTYAKMAEMVSKNMED